MELLDHLPGWGERRPAYSTLPTTPTVVTDASSVQDGGSQQDHVDALRAPSSLSRFLADFTLGFADGLTVPFALTAGLSSLGQTNTVIYAGMAEICAGCISMGIGGYLAAKGEQRSDVTNGNHSLQTGSRDDDEEKSTSPVSPENQEVGDYVARLQLPPELLRSVMAHVESSPEIAARVRESTVLAIHETIMEPVRTSPLVSGLSVALGYLLGGSLPLAPYFFVGSVTRGLFWSFGICILALFIFGFTKEYVLHFSSTNHEWNSRTVRSRLLRWDLIKHGLWEGFRMVIFGGIAAVAAVLCVKLFEGVVT
ncbi:Ccc1 family [Xylaria cf. heliscus]|nr:Ccc1 family [Xylaria cf. heliscus]